MTLPVTRHSLKRKLSDNGNITNICILCKEPCSENRSSFPVDQWESFEATALEWKGLDKFGFVYEDVNWENGPNGLYFHKLPCQLNFKSSRKLDQAKARQKSLEKEIMESEASAQIEDNLESPYPEGSSSKRLTRSRIPTLHEKHLCVWCMNPADNKHIDRNPFRKMELDAAWNRFKLHTVYIDDEVLRDRLIALIDSTLNPFASEIWYHESCFKKYLRPTYDESDLRTIEIRNVRIPEINLIFLEHVRKRVIDMNEPRTLKGLLLDYQELSNKYGVSTESYKTSMIKVLIQGAFKDEIDFHRRYHKNESTIVYKKEAGGSFIEAAIYSWGISNEQILNTAARRLQEHFKDDNGIPWPPSVDDVEGDEDPDPLLYKFVSWLKNPADTAFTMNPGSIMLSSLIKSRIINKRTILKTKLSCTIHGITRSREIVDIIKKLELGVSYQDTKNLYSTWTSNDLKSSSCPAEIAENVPGTAIMDNDDFKDDTLTGANTSHRTNVMFVQPEYLIRNDEAEKDKPVLCSHKELQSLAEDRNKITPYKTIKVGVPPIRETFDTAPTSTAPICKEEMIHTMSKIDTDYSNIEPENQEIGSFSGFQSMIRPPVLKSKPFYFLTFPKPPHKSVVNEVMNRMLRVIEEKNMPFILLVGDQPVYTLIVQLRNENKKFHKILPILGPFHCQCSFVNAINKRFAGSGLSDLIVTTDIIAEKSVDQAFKAKHYARIMRALQLTYEALQRRIVRIGIKEGIDISDQLKALLDVLRHPSRHTKAELKEAYLLIKESDEFDLFIQKAYTIIKSYKSEMADYWLSFMEMYEILIMNVHSLKTQNWVMFKESLRLMIPWMQIYDNNKYGKWLVEFWTEMSTLPRDIDIHMERGLFSQSITGNSYSCLPLDLWIEMTMNKGSKMKAGWKRILRNESMLLSHTLTANYVNRVRVSLHKVSNIKPLANVHKENTTKRKNVDERSIQDLDDCLVEFDCDPFDPHQTKIRTLHSGEYASVELQKDFETAKVNGEELLQGYLEDRVFSKNTAFDETIHKNNRKNFLTPPSTAPGPSKPTKTAAMENEAMCKVVSLCCEENLSLTDIMEYRVTEECLASFNINGSMVKTQKSKMKDALKFVPLPYEKQRAYTVLVDMGFLWRLCTPQKEDREKNEESMYTWRDYAIKMYETITSRHKNANKFILVNDPYHIEDSIKDSEHDKRRKENYQCGSKNIIIKPDGKFPQAREFKEFFTNKKNKIRLQEFLRHEFSDYASRDNIEMIYSIQEQCFDLRSQERVREFECDKTEADDIIFFIYSEIRKENLSGTVIIDAEDTDIIVLAARVAHEIEGDLGIKWKKNIFDCKMLCSKELSTVIVQWYVHCGADAVSAFFGHGKKSVLKDVLKCLNVAKLLANVGMQVPITNSAMDNLRACTIRIIYRDQKSLTLTEARARKWHLMKKKSFSRIPPDEDTHSLHAERVNYQCYVYLNYAYKGCLSSPKENGWTTQDGKCYPLRYKKPALPSNIVELIKQKRVLVEEQNEEESITDGESEDESSDDEDEVGEFEY